MQILRHVVSELQASDPHETEELPKGEGAQSESTKDPLGQEEEIIISYVRIVDCPSVRVVTMCFARTFGYLEEIAASIRSAISRDWADVFRGVPPGVLGNRSRGGVVDATVRYYSYTVFSK